LKSYQAIIEYVKNEVPGDVRSAFDKEVELTREMIAMIPNKIDKVNYGQMNYLE